MPASAVSVVPSGQARHLDHVVGGQAAGGDGEVTEHRHHVGGRVGIDERRAGRDLGSLVESHVCSS
jgi:hypothetical protein